MNNQGEILHAYIGTYTSGASQGIYHGLFHTDTGRLELTGSTGGIPNPSFLAVDPQRHCLYVASEVEDFQGQDTGGLYAYALDEQTGQPRLLNAQPSGGAAPCHFCVDRAARFVLAANYGGGSVALLPIREDGSLDAPSAIDLHHGTGPSQERQDRPHAHSAVLDPAHRFAVCADLGLDRVFVYEPNAEAGTLTAQEPPSVSAPGGSGPRHSVFHPNGRFLYTNTELSSEVLVWAYDGTSGVLRDVQRVSALPDGTSDQSLASGIVVHPSGRFLYSANRGPDTIAQFAVDSETGQLTGLGAVPSGGKNPRDLTLDPSGKFLLAMHQDSGSVVVFTIESQTGKLTPTGQDIAVPEAASLAFWA